MTAYREPYKKPLCMHCGGTVGTTLKSRSKFLFQKDKKHFFCTLRCGFIWAIGRIQSDKAYDESVARRSDT